MATEQETAAEFGYSIAFFKSVPELYSLLKTATANNYSPARFVAGLQNTKWFRTSSESMRKYTALKSSDPATFKQQLATIATHIGTVGNAMGAILQPNEVQQVADLSLRMGWSEEQLKRYLVGRLDYNQKAGVYYGAAAAAQSQINALTDSYGIDVSQHTLGSWVKQMVLGDMDANSVRMHVQQTAASKYVALKDRIMAGETVRDIADPYLQSYAKLLELNPQTVKLEDAAIQKALQSRDAKGVPTTQTVYEFEQGLRNDPRWAKTKNAQDLATTTANEILRTFGLV